MGSFPLFWTAAEGAVAFALLFLLVRRKGRADLPVPVRFRCGVWGAAILSAGMAFGSSYPARILWFVCAGLVIAWCVWTVRRRVRRIEPFVSLLVPAALAGLLWYLR